LPGLNSEEKACSVALTVAAKLGTLLLNFSCPNIIVVPCSVAKDAWAVVKHKTRFKNFHLGLRYSNNYAFIFCLHLVYFISLVCLSPC